MGKGMGAGIVSGGFVGVVVMTMLSLYAPLPQDRIDAAPKLDVETQKSDAVAPEATDTSAAPLESEDVTVAGNSDEATAPTVTSDASTQTSTAQIAPTQEDAPVVQATTPELDANSTSNADSPTAEIASSDARAAGLVPNTPIVQAEDDDSIVIASADPAPSAATQVEAGAQAPTVDPAPSVEVSTDAASPTIQPSALPSPTVVGTEQIVEGESPDQPEPRASALPIVTTPKVIELAAADTPITLPQIDSGVVTNRLPSVGDEANTLVPATPETDEPAAPIAAEDLGALRAYGATVEGAEGKALFGIVLIDSGEDGVPREDLMKLSIPVTIAIDPTAPNATQIMQGYRDAGIEVVAIVNELPTASSPSDVAVSIEAYFDQLPQAVGIMDPLDGRIQSNRTLLQPVLGAIRNSGHGLITYDRGLNTAQQAARREDIPAATVFRVLDADLEEGPKIKRYLDRAAFNANRDGSVVVVGRSYPETIKAIVEWVLEKKEAGIAMVPVSTVMLADEAS